MFLNNISVCTVSFWGENRQHHHFDENLHNFGIALLQVARNGDAQFKPAILIRRVTFHSENCTESKRVRAVARPLVSQ